MRLASKSILKVISFSVLILFIGLTAFFLIYPNWNNIVLAKKELSKATDIRSTSYNMFMQTFTTITPHTVQQVSSDLTSEGALEFLSQEQLANSGLLNDSAYLLTNRNAALQIDSANIAGKLYEGEDAFTMDKGFWHYPLSVLPGQQGNFVVIGHRFDKIPPRTDTFYNLDKVAVGDRIKIKIDMEDYTYIVSETKIVEKTAVSVLKNSTDYRITIITCHPLWTSDQRLVVVGKLDKVLRNI